MPADIEASRPPSLDEKKSLDESSSSASDKPSKGEHRHVSAGVLRMEALAAYSRKPEARWMLWTVGVSVAVMYWMYSQQVSTSSSYAVFATSAFKQHSTGLATLSIATSIIGAVCRPFLAKASDVFSRPWLCVVALVGYVIGFCMILKSPNLPTYVVGNVFVAIGTAGLTTFAAILNADLVPLKWRGVGHAVLASPYIVVPWYSAHIVSALKTGDKWRWGYGMYAIIAPVVMIPGIVLLFWMQKRAEPVLVEKLAEKEANGEHVAVLSSNMSVFQRIVLAWHELDGFGLLLLGFGWSLLLLPFSLSKYADHGYHNRSLIAMFVVGALCLIAYVPYELKWAKYPSAPLRLIKNKTFLTAVVIDFIYMMAGYIHSLYLSSYAYIVTDWTVVEWNYWDNTLTVALCFGGLLAGFIQRFTHRYKFLQIFGLIVKIVGYGLIVDKNGVHDTARLVISQVLVGIGGSFSVVGSDIGSQASVPHQDVALAISMLTLWSSIGRSVGSAIASSHWNSVMESNMRRFMPDSVTDAQIRTYFSSITKIKALPYHDPVRQGAIQAYETTVYPLWAASLGLSFIALIAAVGQSNFYLGDAQNAYDGRDNTGAVIEEDGQKKQEGEKAKGWRRVLRFWDL